MGVQINGDTGNISATKADYSGNVSIGETITATSYSGGVNVGGALTVTTSNSQVGIFTANSNGANIRLFDNDTESKIRTVDGRLQLYADVQDAVADSEIKFYIDNDVKGFISAGSSFSLGNDADTYISRADANTLAVTTGGSERTRITSAGKVGIGTDEPDGLLHLTATNGDCELILESDTDNDNEYDNPRIIFRQDGHASQSSIGIGGTDNDSDMHNALTLKNSVSTDGGIIFMTNNVNGSLTPYQQHLEAVERARFTSNGDFLFKKTSASQQATGVQFEDHGLAMFTKDNIVAYFTRTSSDGQMIRFYGDTTSEGSINISGSSISYNGGVLTRWSQIVGISTNNKADRPTIYQGTIMSNLDEMADWGDEENMQLNKTQVSTVSGDKNVAGVFWAWDDDDDTYLNDYYVAQTGDFIIRVGAATTITRGDLLESAGDGTAKPQSDDIVRSKTVAKVTSGIAHTTYPDGTKTYPCVLMAS